MKSIIISYLFVFIIIINANGSVSKTQFKTRQAETESSLEEKGELITKKFEVTLCVFGLNALIVSKYGVLSTINTANYAGINSPFIYSGGYGADASTNSECPDRYNADVLIDGILNKWSYPNILPYILDFEDRDRASDESVTNCSLTDEQNGRMWESNNEVIFVFEHFNGGPEEFKISCDISYYKKQV